MLLLQQTMVKNVNELPFAQQTNGQSYVSPLKPRVPICSFTLPFDHTVPVLSLGELHTYSNIITYTNTYYDSTMVTALKSSYPQNIIE